jgi:uncharacterized protein YegP (UPF0339 family)
VAVGEAYEQYAGCLNGIRSVKKNSGSPIEDLTEEGGPRFPNPKYQMFKDATGKYRFHLKAGNGEIIATGEGYETRESCLNGIDAVKNSVDAEVEDPFAIKKPIIEAPVAAKTEEMPKPQPLMIEPETPLVETKTEMPLVATKPESPEPFSPPSPPESTMVEEVGPVETTLELFAAPADITEGTHLTFKGKLYGGKSGRGIPGAKIHIFERDSSILGDDYLAYGTTGDDGVFNIDWHSRPLTWRKNTGDIYAKFNGNEKAKPSKSAVQTITFG